MRGERAVSAMTNAEVMKLFAYQLEDALDSQANFNKVSVDDQDCIVQNAWMNLFLVEGEKDFDKLPPEEKQRVDFFVRVGCAMHKDLNWTKGAAEALRLCYNDLEIELRPMDLPNKAAAEAKLQAEAQAKQEASSKGERKLEQVVKFVGVVKKKGADTPRGGVRAVGVAAAVLNHSDDDCGEHDTWRWWMERKTGQLITFPDASNNRYRSFGDGAIILILYWDEIREYLSQMRVHKTSQTFVNIQKNI
jgi:hypothetical protein